MPHCSMSTPIHTSSSVFYIRQIYRCSGAVPIHRAPVTQEKHLTGFETGCNSRQSQKSLPAIPVTPAHRNINQGYKHINRARLV